MLSQPMAGKTEQEIKETREKAIKALENMGYEIVNTLFTDDWYSKENMEKRGVVQIPLCFLAKALKICHCVMRRIFVKVGKKQEAARLNTTQRLLTV